MKLERDFQVFHHASRGAKTAWQIEQAQAETDARIRNVADRLISLYDSFEKIGEAGDPESLNSSQLLQRVQSYEVLAKQLSQALDALGVEQFRPLGQSIDEDQHHVERSVADPQQAPGTIVEVLESGYRWNGKLIRPARVVVTKPK